MIYLEMYGRCGNQMFRYAAARALQLKFYPGEQIEINFQQVDEAHEVDQTYVNVLQDLNVSAYKIYKKDGKPLKNETSVIQRVIGFIYYLGLKRFNTFQMTKQLNYQKKWSQILNKLGLYWYRTGYIKINKANVKNKFVSGGFEAPQYFKEFKEIIRNEFTPIHPPIEKNKHLYEIIERTNSICLNVRRGDFVSDDINNPDIKKVHHVCNKNYYINAIEKAKEILINPTFIVFSDDINWVRDNIDTGVPTYYEDGDDPVWETMRMMSKCKHFIISNSTFGWWAQYLSRSSKKVVFCPERWFNNDYISPLIDNDWIKIPVD